MARLTYRKSIKVAPGVRLNVTHKGVRSISAGAKGLRLTQDLHNDRRGGTRARVAAAPARAPKPTAAERNAALEARLGPEAFARHQENSRLVGWLVAAMATLLFSFVVPLLFLVSLPLMVVAIVKAVRVIKAQRQRA